MKQRSVKQQAERVIDIVKNQFNGMVSENDKPSSSLSMNYSSKKINLIDYGDYSEGRTGCRSINQTLPNESGIVIFCAKPISHPKWDVTVWIINRKLYVSTKNPAENAAVFTRIYPDVYGYEFGYNCTMKIWNDDVIIFDSGKLFKLVVADIYKTKTITGDQTLVAKALFHINPDCPAKTLTNVPETSTKVLGYNYTYTYVKLNFDNAFREEALEYKVLDMNRYSYGMRLEFETGTCIAKNQADLATIYKDPDNTEESIGNFQCPCAKNPIQATHYGVYRTKNIGENSTPPGINAVNGLGNNSQLLVWIADIPMIKAFRATIGEINQDGTAILNSLSSYTVITEYDIGCTVYWSTGSGVIKEKSGLNIILKDIVGTIAASTIAGIGMGAPVGGSFHKGTFSGTTVTKVTGRNFHASDIGKPLFLEIGEIVWITEVISTTQVKINAPIYNWSGFDDVVFGMSQYTSAESDEKYLTRTMSDTIPDSGLLWASVLTNIIGEQFGIQEKIDSAKDYYYPRRFFTPIPCGVIGLIDGGYLLTAERDSSIIYYSQISDRPYSMGYHRIDIQKQEVDAGIRAIESISGNISIFLKSKTKAMTSRVSTNVGNGDLGEAIFKLQQASTISENVGIYSYGSIAYLGSNAIVALTNELSVRMFDGTAWSNFDYTSGLVGSVFKTIDPNYAVIAIYSPEGGYKIWFNVWYKSTNTNLIAKKCYRLAINKSQGIGWSEFTGEWVWPSNPNDVYNYIDASNVERSFVKDWVRAKSYEIDTFNRQNYLGPTYLDKDVSGTGTEIATEDWLPEIMVPNNAGRSQLRHEVSKDSVRPLKWENRGATGYTASGLRTGQDLSLDVYVDGEKVTPAAYSSDYPEDADVTFKGVKISGERLQFVHKSTASEFRRVSTYHKLLTQPQVAPRLSRKDLQSGYQELMVSGKLIHITRGKTPFYDLVSKNVFSGSGTKITGPDGLSGTAISLTSTLQLGSFGSSDYTILFWYKTGLILNQFTSTAFVGAIVNDWRLVRGIKTGTLTNVVLQANEIYDLRLYNKTISTKAALDYYNDVVKNAGNAYLPRY